MKKIVWISLIIGVLLLAGGVGWFVTRPIKIGVIISTETSVGNEANLAIRFYGVF